MIVARVRRTIAERGLLRAGDHVLVACSGGPDSAALLSVLATLAGPLGLRLSAASVDHGLRAGAERDVEAARVQAAQVAVPFQAVKLNLDGAPGVQARARVARYAALQEMAAGLGACAIAVGHTLDDQAETVLMRILRGSAVCGLAGVQPRREDGVVRPLIDCRREAVHAYARAQFARLADDPSNADTGFLRVRMRAQLLPRLRGEDPEIDVHLANLADDAREIEALLNSQADALLAAAAVPGGVGLSLEQLSAAPAVVAAAALRRWVVAHSGRDPGRAVQTQLRDLLRGHGEVWLHGGAKALVDGQTVRFIGAASE